MKSISSAYKKGLKNELSSIATLWRIERSDGRVYSFTDHDKDIFFNNIVYKSSGGFSPSAIETSSNLSVDNLIIETIIDNHINESDILSGKFDNAKIYINEIDWRNPERGVEIERVGSLGELKLGRISLIAEMRGLTQRLSQTVSKFFVPGCQANLGDSQCKKVLSSYTFNGIVSSVISNRVFNSNLSNANNYFNNGILRFTSGSNKDIRVEVKEYKQANGEVSLYNSMTQNIVVGDSFTVHRGCDKSIDTCKSVFNNVVNFRGFPHIPGYDNIYKN